VKPSCDEKLPFLRRRGRPWILPALLVVALSGICCFGGLPAFAAEQGDGEPPRPETPPEHRGSAVPNQRPETEARFQLAEQHFRREEWAAGLAVFDEILAEATSPERARRERSEAARRRRELEKALKEAQAEQAGAGLRQQQIILRGGPAAGPDPVGDDELAPTVEVYSRDGIFYLPVAAAVRQRLLDLPVSARQLYLRTFEAPAARALEAAMRLPFSSSIEELRRARERYPLTEAGRRAAEELASRLADLGRLDEAALEMEERLALPFGSPAARAEALAQAALHRLLAGQPLAGRERLSRLAAEHNESPIPLRGEAVLAASIAGHELFEGAARRAVEATKPPSAWPAVLGSYQRGALSLDEEELPSLGSEARWIFSFAEQASSSRSPASRSPRGRYPAIQAVTDGERLFVRRRSEVISIDVAGGKIRWIARPERPAQPPEPYSQIFTAGDEDFSDIGGRTLTLIQPSGSRPAVVVVDHTLQGYSQMDRIPAPLPNRLLAYDAATGKLLWQAGGGRKRGDARLDGLAFTAAPTPAGGVLVAPASRDGGHYLAGIEPGGRLRWLQRLYSFNPAAYQRYGVLSSQGASVAASEGLAFSAPGQGIVAAVEAASGRCLWMSRYRSKLRDRTAGGRFFHSHPLVVRGPRGRMLVIAPADSDHLSAFDPESGALLWERHLASGSLVILGSDERHIYSADDHLLAHSLADGKQVWASSSFDGYACGQGFVAAGRAYVPLSRDQIAVLSTADGSDVALVGIRDPRLAGNLPFNIFPFGGQLITASSRGVEALRPQAESWTRLHPDEGRDLFQRGRLLLAERNFGAALDVLYDLLRRFPEGPIHERLVRMVRETVSDASRSSGDPAFIRRLLDFEPGIVKPRSAVLALRLWEAQLEEKRSPRHAVTLYTQLLREEGRMASSPEGNTVDVGLHAAGALRRILSKEGAELDATPEAAARLRLDEERAAEALALAEAAGPGREQARHLAGLVIRSPQTAASVEAAERLAAIHEASGDLPAAAAYLGFLAGHRRSPESEALRKRLAELDAPTARELRLVLDGPAGPAWRQVFWKTQEEGFLVATAPGSDPLPLVLAIQGRRLRGYDTAGAPRFERDLPGYPDVEQVKLQMQSHLEEPAIAHRRGRRLVLFTAAGCYGFRWEARAGGSPALRLAWVQGHTHPLELLAQNRPRWGWGSVQLPRDVNFFPEVFFSPSGDPTVLFPDGELRRIDAESGKLRWRFRPDGHQVLGQPLVEGRWVTVRSASPPGLLRYRSPEESPAGEAARASGRDLQFIPLAERPAAGHLLSGLAVAAQGQRLEVRSGDGRRLIWSRSTGSRIVMATPSHVWTTKQGEFKARGLFCGNPEKRIELPSGTMVHSLFDDPLTDRQGMTLVTSSSMASPQYYYSQTQSGSRLHLVRLDQKHEKVWEKELARRAVTYDGRRHLLEDGRWLLAYNEQDDAEKWYTRVVALEPESGAAEPWFGIEIPGKGTGQPPRLATVAGGLAAGNAEGFGWFTALPLELPESPEAAEAGRAGE
jgi:outer membrane protein assembly factor BamB